VTMRDGLHARIMLWNSCLQTKVKDFLEEKSGTTGVIFDVASVFTEVLDNPTKFGFKDARDHGEEDCVWADVLHPTSKMHQIIAKEFVKVLEGNPL
jgi:phospholipase/lecithinase/hemolysin